MRHTLLMLLALVKAVQAVKGSPERPEVDRLEALGERYRPYRSVATQLYWHHYLSSSCSPSLHGRRLSS